jgi:hypothetical protein
MREDDELLGMAMKGIEQLNETHRQAPSFCLAARGPGAKPNVGGWVGSANEESWRN